MKKICLILIISILLVGCSGGDSDTPNTPETPASGVNGDPSPGDVEDTGYIFETKDIEIAMNSEVAPIIGKLGDSKEYFEAEHCALPGLEKTYTFDGFELYTYEIEGVDSVASISFLDDSVKTKEGIYLYSSLDDVIEAYGDDYEQKLGLYTYESGDCKLSFLIEDEEVVSIEYIAITD